MEYIKLSTSITRKLTFYNKQVFEIFITTNLNMTGHYYQNLILNLCLPQAQDEISLLNESAA